MEDSELVELIANIWISNGGDAEGFSWLDREIQQRIKSKEILDEK